MARRTPRSKSRASRFLSFWSVVLMLCVFVGTASFLAGRYIIGEKLEAGTPVREITTDLLRDQGADQPPPRPMVEVLPAEETPTAEPAAGEEQPEEEGEAAPTTTPRATPPPVTEPPWRTTPRGGVEEREEGSALREPAPPERAGPSPPRRPPASAPSQYVVRAGSFTNTETLEARKAALLQRGYQFWVTPHERDGRIYYRVNVGEFPTESEAKRFERELESQGIDADVVPGE